MNNYQIKRAARIDRLNAAAERAAKESEAAVSRAMRMAEAIPFGQPILIGHHSEKRDRNYRAKIDNGFRKAFEKSKEAEELAYRAASAESNTAISSDDPDAIDALKSKLADMEAQRERYKAINATIRKTKGTDEAKADAIVAAGLASEKIAAELVKPDFCGRIGIPSYALSNLNGNIKRVRDRIEGLEKLATITHEEIQIGSVTIEGPIDNRLRIHFPGKPSAEIIKELKSSGFRWAPSEGAWQRMYSNQAIWQAKRIAGMVAA